MSPGNKSFLFGEKRSEKLNANINMRAIGVRAKEWEHPVYGLFRMAEERKKVNGDILKTPKRAREIYAISIIAMAMQYDYEEDWWINASETEDSDGLIMTFSGDEKNGQKGLMREVQVVEHREDSGEIFDTIFEKISETAYSPDMILVCLALTNGIYNFELLSERLKQTPSTFEHIFLVFAGVGLIDPTIPMESIRRSYSLVQLTPKFARTTFDYGILLEDFDKKFKMGRESKSINGNKIFFTTRNKTIPLAGEVHVNIK